MTYEEAVQWLKSKGGTTWCGPSTEVDGQLIVHVTIPSGGMSLAVDDKAAAQHAAVVTMVTTMKGADESPNR